MRNPLRDLSRPKSLAVAGVAAGVFAVAGAAAAVNVGLLSSGSDEPFSPEPVAASATDPATGVTQAPEVVYQDVYEFADGLAGTGAPTLSAEAPGESATAAVPWAAPDSDDGAEPTDPSYDGDDHDGDDHDGDDHDEDPDHDEDEHLDGEIHDDEFDD